MSQPDAELCLIPMNTDFLSTTEPTQILLEIPESVQKSAQENSQKLSFPKERWQNYINQLCFDTVLSWLQEETENASSVWSRLSLPSFWTFISGTAITINEKRVILIPNETIDTSELRVPQEWVDIPNWVGDYYFAIQVNPDDGLIQTWGYTTHAQLKQQGNYDYENRCYVLNAEDIVDDVSAFWVAQEQCSQEETRAEVSSLATLSLQQAENLLERLSNSDVLEPRLAIPFENWGALLAHDGWRQRLYERRQGIAEQRSILQWLQSGISEIAQQVGWQKLDLQPELEGARGTQVLEKSIAFSRRLKIENQSYELQIRPFGDPTDRIWRFQLQPMETGKLIPAGVTLRLLTEDLQPFEGNEVTAITLSQQLCLYIELAIAPNEGIVWETEPKPEGYEREILRF